MFSHICTFMTEQLHWLPLSARIQFEIRSLDHNLLVLAHCHIFANLGLNVLSLESMIDPSLSIDRSLMIFSPLGQGHQRAFASAAWSFVVESTLRLQIRAQILSASSSPNKPIRHVECAGALGRVKLIHTVVPLNEL